MESYKTDDEQIEELKRWWRENGKSTVLGILLALGGFFGWQAWQDNQETKAELASNLFQGLLDADARAADDASALEKANTFASRIKLEYPKTSYAHFAAMHKAKYAASAGKWQEAESELRWVLDNKPDPLLAVQAKINLAKTQLAREQYDAALSTLTIAEPKAYEALVEETRGDIYLAQGNKTKALSHYELANAAREALATGTPNQMLDIKLQELRASVGTEGGQ